METTQTMCVNKNKFHPVITAETQIAIQSFIGPLPDEICSCENVFEAQFKADDATNLCICVHTNLHNQHADTIQSFFLPFRMLS